MVGAFALKYTPKHIGEHGNVNVSKSPPLKELAVALSGVLGIIFAIYLVLGFFVDYLLANYEDQVISTLGTILEQTIENDKSKDKEQKLVQNLVDRLVSNSTEPEKVYSVHISASEQVNAIAYPGNRILVYMGLLNKVESENELSMILAHELGHFAKKHHIRGLGRGLVFVAISSIIFGQESAVTASASNFFGLLSAHYSREQESEADLYGLNLLAKTYGHVGGATAFFERMIKTEDSIAYKLFASSHPLSKKRVRDIKRWQEKNNFKLLPLKPLSFEIVSQDK